MADSGDYAKPMGEQDTGKEHMNKPSHMLPKMFSKGFTSETSVIYMFFHQCYASFTQERKELSQTDSPQQKYYSAWALSRSFTSSYSKFSLS